MRIEEYQSGIVQSDWAAFPQSSNTDQELKALKQKQAYNSIYVDTLNSDPKNVSWKQPSSAIEEKLYRRETLASYKSDIHKVPLPSLGVHFLQTPEERANPTPQKKAGDELALPHKTATTAGFFNQVKNVIYNWLGWGVAPVDSSAETPLTGSPKEVYLTERDCEMITKALEQMSLAINKLITKPATDAQESKTDDNDRDKELLQLKQLKNEVEILKAVLAVIRDEIKSKELDAVISTEEISENQNEQKELQAKRLANLEEIDSRVKTSNLLNWIQIGSAGVSAACLIIGIALALSNPATAGVLTAATVGEALTALGAGAANSASMTLSAVSGIASIVQGSATGVNAHQKYETGVKRADNEDINDRSRHLRAVLEAITSTFSNSLNKTNQIYNGLAMIPKSKSETIRYIAMQINR